MGNRIGIRGGGVERQLDAGDYAYLDRPPPALIEGYESLSHMYYAHARMAIVHLNNDTGHFLKHKVIWPTIMMFYTQYVSIIRVSLKMRLDFSNKFPKMCVECP